MFCSTCGNQLTENSKFCIKCGWPVAESIIAHTPSVVSIAQQTITQNNEAKTELVSTTGEKESFSWEKVFSGRIGRMRYFQSHFLLQFAVWIGMSPWLILYVFASARTGNEYVILGDPIFFAYLMVLFVSLSAIYTGVLIRRWHDIGLSGWMALLTLIPLVGHILLLYALFKKGESGPNKYGPAPLYRPFFWEIFNIGNPVGTTHKQKPDWGIRIIIIYGLLVLLVLFAAIMLVSYQRAEDANLVGWISYTPSDNTFFVALPKEPVVQTSIDSPLETPMVSHTYLAEVHRDKAFIVNQTWYAEPVASEPHIFMYNVLLAMIGNEEGSMIASTSYTYHNGLPAFDYFVTNENGDLRGRIIVANENTFYILGESYASSVFNEKEYKGFVESFVYTEQKPSN